MSKIAGTPECRRVRSQIIARESRTAFAAFTGQDSVAYSAFIHGVELWMVGDQEGRNAALDVLRGGVRAMQKKLRYLCKETLITMTDSERGMKLWAEICEYGGWSTVSERNWSQLPSLHELPPQPRDGGTTRQSMPEMSSLPLYCVDPSHKETIALVGVGGRLFCLGCGKDYGRVLK